MLCGIRNAPVVTVDMLVSSLDGGLRLSVGVAVADNKH